MFTTPLREILVRVGEWVLTHSLIWTDTVGPIERRIVVPMRFVTDHASIPKCLRDLLVDSGDDQRPFVLHDWLYCSSRSNGKGIARKEADRLLRVAMVATGHGKLKAWTYYCGVRAGGWQYWNTKARSGLQTGDFLV